jgi:4-carboxymuconolactone decarboxylase
MARMSLPPVSEMTSQQKSVHDEAANGRRGRAPAPLAAWIRVPELASRVQKLGEFLRYETRLPPRLSELAILVTARHWTSHWEWKVHKQEALKGGLSADIIDAIAAHRLPVFAAEDEKLVFRISTTLLREHTISDELYREATDVLGEAALVELIGVLGYYALVSMTLNTFEIGMPDAFQTELAGNLA